MAEACLPEDGTLRPPGLSRGISREISGGFGGLSGEISGGFWGLSGAIDPQPPPGPGAPWWAQKPVPLRGAAMRCHNECHNECR